VSYHKPNERMCLIMTQKDIMFNNIIMVGAIWCNVIAGNLIDHYTYILKHKN